MTDGWDLHAVVRSCTPTIDNVNTNNRMEDLFPKFASLTFQNDAGSPFSCQDDNTDFRYQGLDEIYKELCTEPDPIITSPPVSELATSIPKSQGFEVQHQQPRMSRNSRNDFPAQIHSRRRKNQQMKMVHQLTQEQLSADLWSWRKYGQKPIKGSPYPSGEHAHPRPTHRSSLAGSTRSKPSAGARTAVVPEPSCSSSSLASGSSFSPTASLPEGASAAWMEDDVVEMEEATDDDDLLIPNTVMTEDIFKGFQELSSM
ncbi:hypothetical protein RJ639_014953 [Escallonia herrerae]|uniref:WRKY domain-containing protein n=1 Tax=Escallonia herrerae TaxID=1293975 RepID=A0AA89AMQ8_9ASTE|nr:hypothetical protein RJ639_014953 [Escallonia herrerae]